LFDAKEADASLRGSMRQTALQANKKSRPLSDGNFYLVFDVRQKRNLACALDCGSQLALVPCACTGDAARQYLCALADALAEPCDIFVIDALDLVDAELAYLSAPAACACGALLLLLALLRLLRGLGALLFGGCCLFGAFSAFGCAFYLFRRALGGLGCGFGRLLDFLNLLVVHHLMKPPLMLNLLRRCQNGRSSSFEISTNFGGSSNGSE